MRQEWTRFPFHTTWLWRFFFKLSDDASMRTAFCMMRDVSALVRLGVALGDALGEGGHRARDTSRERRRGGRKEGQDTADRSLKAAQT